MIERHHDYVLRGVSVPAGGSATYVINLDVDAPFALRTLAATNFFNDSSLAGAFQFIITGFDDRKYMGGNGNPLVFVDSLLNINGATGTAFFMFYPQITFPAQLTIQVTIFDVAGLGLQSGNLTFRGTKLYPEGAVFGPQYPPKFTELMFRYPYKFTVPQGTVSVPTVLANQPLDIQSDADFVVRMASSFVQPGADGFVIGQNDVILRDQYGKPYSNTWVPTELLFPVAGVQTLGGPAYSVPDATIFPEIYLAKNTQLLLDIRRTGGTQSNKMNFVLAGSKIFPLPC
jgi:hypothetical protein